MFVDFLYLLRENGLKISTTQWMSLMEGMRKNLHGGSFFGFYTLCRALLIKSETEFDRFDRCFLNYFRNVPFEQEITQEMLDDLDRPDFAPAVFDEQQALINMGLSPEEIEKMLEERLKEQKEEHNGGKYWVGTHGMSVFGNSGASPNGIRVGGESQNKSAFRVAGERKYRDFRGDNTLDTRQFEVALRHLRQYSGLVDLAPTEFDVDGTIDDTCQGGGMLSIRYKKPRRNTVKVLLLMDSGGSMDYYSHLCSSLFQAVGKTRHFKDLKVYYFHNCVYGTLYETPYLHPGEAVNTQWVLENLPSDYKVIFVGDAQMAHHELLGQRTYRTQEGGSGKHSGLDWLLALKTRYPHAVWMNPSPRPEWGGNYWSLTYDTIAENIPMFPLTVDGLGEGMKKLLVK